MGAGLEHGVVELSRPPCFLLPGAQGIAKRDDVSVATSTENFELNQSLATAPSALDFQLGNPVFFAVGPECEPFVTLVGLEEAVSKEAEVLVGFDVHGVLRG